MIQKSCQKYIRTDNYSAVLVTVIRRTVVRSSWKTISPLVPCMSINMGVVCWCLLGNAEYSSNWTPFRCTWVSYAERREEFLSPVNSMLGEVWRE